MLHSYRQNREGALKFSTVFSKGNETVVVSMFAQTAELAMQKTKFIISLFKKLSQDDLLSFYDTQWGSPHFEIISNYQKLHTLISSDASNHVVQRAEVSHYFERHNESINDIFLDFFIDNKRKVLLFMGQDNISSEAKFTQHLEELKFTRTLIEIPKPRVPSHIDLTMIVHFVLANEGKYLNQENKKYIFNELSSDELSPYAEGLAKILVHVFELSLSQFAWSTVTDFAIKTKDPAAVIKLADNLTLLANQKNLTNTTIEEACASLRNDKKQMMRMK